jgi:hypothetical protein
LLSSANIIADKALRNALQAIEHLDAAGQKVLHVELRSGRAVIQIDPPTMAGEIQQAGALTTRRTQHGVTRSVYVLAAWNCQIEWEQAHRPVQAAARA